MALFFFQKKVNHAGGFQADPIDGPDGPIANHPFGIDQVTRGMSPYAKELADLPNFIQKGRNTRRVFLQEFGNGFSGLFGVDTIDRQGFPSIIMV